MARGTDGRNLLANCDWDGSDFTGWKVETRAAIAESEGLVEIAATVTNSSRYGVYQTVAVTAGTDMVLSCDFETLADLHVSWGAGSFPKTDCEFSEEDGRAVARFNTGDVTSLTVYVWGRNTSSSRSVTRVNRLKLEYGSDPFPFYVSGGVAS